MSRAFDKDDLQNQFSFNSIRTVLIKIMILHSYANTTT